MFRANGVDYPETVEDLASLPCDDTVRVAVEARLSSDGWADVASYVPCGTDGNVCQTCNARRIVAGN